MAQQERWVVSSTDIIFQAGDVAAAFLTGVLAFFFYFHQLYLPHSYWVAILIETLLVAYIFPKYRLYSSHVGDRSKRPITRKLVMAAAVTFLLLVSVGFFTKTTVCFSRFWFGSWCVFDFITLILLRVIQPSVLDILKRYGRKKRRVLIIGQSEVGQTLGEYLRECFSAEFSVVDWIKIIPAFTHCSFKDLVMDKRIEEIWLCLSLQQQGNLKNILLQLSDSIVTVRYFPDIPGVNLKEEAIVNFLGFPMVNLIASPMVGLNQFVKEIEDRCLSLLILILISPLMLIIAFLIKTTSRGPVFYRQKRVGWNGHDFEMLKFRSMSPDAEAKTGAVWCIPGDPRVTPLGRFLRKTSMDELPQFINVLWGDMSIVGPRPERPELIEKFKGDIPNYMKKHLVKAGITGWAQVNGWRGNTDLNKRIELDLYYINHWSVLFDLKIILLTIWRGFLHKNAY